MLNPTRPRGVRGLWSIRLQKVEGAITDSVWGKATCFSFQTATGERYLS